MGSLTSQIAEMAKDYDLFDFIRGQADCRDGVAHKDGHGASYDCGYAAQYELEQILSERTSA